MTTCENRFNETVRDNGRSGTGLRRGLRWVLIAIAILVALPPVIGLLVSEDSRQLEALALDDTDHSEVTFRNEQQDLDLAGMLFRPQGEAPFPAAVIIQGSGTSSRDNGWYLTVANHLQHNGILVLLPDKRGSEQSEGDWRTASFEDLATDTQAAVSFLASDYSHEVTSIGVLGMSQGGRIAPIVASQHPDVAWVVNVVGGAVPAYQSLRYEETHNLRKLGFLPGVSDVLAYPSTWMLVNVTASEFWNAVGNFDPIPYWRQLDQPALVVYGENDTNTATEASVERLNQLDNPNIEIQVYEGSGHAIEDPEGQGNSIFRSDALNKITKFILEHS
jgi:pimeloyl-ACP methyl ester carboxylesterase